MTILSPEQYAIERSICDHDIAFRAKPENKGLTYLACNNDMRGRVELYELNRDRPERFSCYISTDEKSATVWTGLVVGRVTHKGRAIRPFNGPGRVFQFHVTTIWGARYAGRGQGGGMFINLRRCKA